MKKVAVVEFWDHVSFEHSDGTQVEEMTPNRCVAIGFVEEDNEDYVRLVWYKNDPLYERPEHFRGVTIVRGAIINMTTMKSPLVGGKRF